MCEVDMMKKFELVLSGCHSLTGQLFVSMHACARKVQEKIVNTKGSLDHVHASLAQYCINLEVIA